MAILMVINQGILGISIYSLAVGSNDYNCDWNDERSSEKIAVWVLEFDEINSWCFNPALDLEINSRPRDMDCQLLIGKKNGCSMLYTRNISI